MGLGERAMMIAGIERAESLYKRLSDTVWSRGMNYLYISDFSGHRGNKRSIMHRVSPNPVTEPGWCPIAIVYKWGAWGNQLQIVPHPEILINHKDIASTLVKLFVKGLKADPYGKLELIDPEENPSEV